MSVEIRRGSARFVDRVPGRATSHAFSFGPHYDPDRVSFGPMVCHDDHLMGGGVGFETHRHSGLEIVTWVVSGALEHTDGDGNRATLLPGTVAHLSAGSGVEHSEVAAVDAGPTRFVQVWLTPEYTGATGETGEAQAPTYDVRAVPLESGRLTPAVVVGAATFAVARLGVGDHLVLPTAPRLHAFVATGALLRTSLAEPLHAGDAFLMSDEPSHTVSAGVPTEVLVWTLP